MAHSVKDYGVISKLRAMKRRENFFFEKKKQKTFGP
jgi:hypothetical protein